MDLRSQINTEILFQMSEQEILEKVSKNDIKSFNYLVELHYTKLLRSSLKYVRRPELAEEIVQDVFVALWNKRQTLEIKISLSAYLHTAVKYRSLNQLKSDLLKPKFESEFPESVPCVLTGVEDEIMAQDLGVLITKAIETLPKKCRIIFDLSRNGGLTYKEIATELNISQKTVETQISIALSRIKVFLGKHWDNLIYILLSIILF